MPIVSAGLLMFRGRGGRLEVLLAHPGGPFFADKDAGVWTVPKGEIDPGEDALAAARREFEEETGLRAEGEFTPLGEIVQKNGKIVRAWAFPGDCEPATLKSNTFPLEWPPKSGRFVTIPEIDRADFFPIDEARRRIIPAQIPLLETLERLVPSGDLR